ncbi:MAG: hypothetical protein Q9183_006105 [Haloplaca sp. 2 TL-2023]
MPSKTTTSKKVSTALQPRDSKHCHCTQGKGDEPNKKPVEGNLSVNVGQNTSKKRAHSDDDINDGLSPAKANKKPKRQIAQRGDKSEPIDLKSIKLPNQESGSVPIYETCDDIRKKINDRLLKTPKATCTASARTLVSYAYLPHPRMVKWNSAANIIVDVRNLRAFMEKKGTRNVRT